MVLNLGQAYSKLTHVLAVAVVVAAGFVVSPAGQALIHQYPKLSGISMGILALAALYRNPSVSLVSK